ncbi:hypothetical protein V5O48_003326, partial [Marasmius crinis-equi]
NNYPLCLSFKAWTPTPPPSRWVAARNENDAETDNDSELPRDPRALQSWTDINYWVRFHDGRCLISDIGWGLTATHLVPADEWQWFEHHRYWDTAHDDAITIDSPRNLVALSGFFKFILKDSSRFVMVPIGAGTGNGFCTVMTDEYAQELAAGIHLRTIKFPRRIRTEYIWARFAWEVIRLASVTICSGYSEHLNFVRVPSSLTPEGEDEEEHNSDQSNDTMSQVSPMSISEIGIGSKWSPQLSPARKRY